MLSTTDFLIRIGCAILTGFIIGLERQLTGHAAGIRINLLVSLGSCMFVLFPMLVGSNDLRSAAQIVSGVGFLCSGIIFKEGLNVRGLNTAATIWCTAAIGVIASSGRLEIAFIATTLLILSNLIFKPLSKKLSKLNSYKEHENYYRLSTTCLESSELIIRGMIITYLQNSNLVLVDLTSSDIADKKVNIDATMLTHKKRRDDIAEDLIAKISLEEGVTSIGWKNITDYNAEEVE